MSARGWAAPVARRGHRASADRAHRPMQNGSGPALPMRCAETMAKRRRGALGAKPARARADPRVASPLGLQQKKTRRQGPGHREAELSLSRICTPPRRLEPPGRRWQRRQSTRSSWCSPSEREPTPTITPRQGQGQVAINSEREPQRGEVDGDPTDPGGVKGTGPPPAATGAAGPPAPPRSPPPPITSAGPPPSAAAQF